MRLAVAVTAVVLAYCTTCRAQVRAPVTKRRRSSNRNERASSKGTIRHWAPHSCRCEEKRQHSYPHVCPPLHSQLLGRASSCPQPKSLTVAATSATGVALTWQAGDGASPAACSGYLLTMFRQDQPVSSSKSFSSSVRSGRLLLQAPGSKKPGKEAQACLCAGSARQRACQGTSAAGTRPPSNLLPTLPPAGALRQHQRPVPQPALHRASADAGPVGLCGERRGRGRRLLHGFPARPRL
jgi:hypothetical protein